MIARISIFALLALVSTMQNAHAIAFGNFALSNLKAAGVWSTTFSQSSPSGPATFGTHSLSGVGEVSTTLNGNVSGSPYIQFLDTTSQTLSTANEQEISASLGYDWGIVGPADIPVLVHISTSGWIDIDYSYLPYQPINYYFYGNLPSVAIAASFRTYTNGGRDQDQRTYGLQTGNINEGVTSVEVPEIFNGIPQVDGGSKRIHADLSRTFDLWATPNAFNSIMMNVYSSLYETSPYVKMYSDETYTFSGFIDPVITIDPTWSLDHPGYSIAVSDGIGNISPTLTSVPEPGTFTLMVLALASMGWLRRRTT